MGLVEVSNCQISAPYKKDAAAKPRRIGDEAICRGDEMSVTVIATGIGEKEKPREREASPQIMDPTYGGKVRDITPADLAPAMKESLRPMA